MTTYLDCNATTPLEPRVQEVVWNYLVEDFGNAGSRTHEFGNRAKQVVQKAREQVASVVRCKTEEVIFTSGATESNNLALLGLAHYGTENGRKHIISSSMEHKAVLEPLEELASRGFDITLINPTAGGWVDPAEVQKALRPDTLLVSLMHVNNETGVIQPIDQVARILDGHAAYFHVDAAQSFGKEIQNLRDPRIELISISGHKIFGPKGVGALITRRRGFKSLPLRPLMFGGGQERGLRPGTVPVHLVAGLGEAAAIAISEFEPRRQACLSFRQGLLKALEPMNPSINGDPDRLVPSTLNVSIPGVSSEAAMVALKGLVAISNGSACTSQSYTPSHVLKSMGLGDDRIREALRISWCHLTEPVDWTPVLAALLGLR
ncbi:cysteine desulfurase [Geothrix oryzae]|uniref:Cysteine desulfurase n=1 Tax=Geothrix oryzae TaxID=2927975 RepID=A0ABN6UVZ6_9BACT|nr:cysteine desulfurase DndA [Geothrix oryzae]BDU68715.1 cysteine desulfurase [Geothrix oryzae]